MNSLHHSANPLHHNTGSQNNCFQRETEWASWTNAWMENGVWVNILSSAAWCFGASSSSLLPPALVQYWALSLRDKKRKSVDFRVSRDFEILWEQELWLEESCKEDKSCLSYFLNGVRHTRKSRFYTVVAISSFPQQIGISQQWGTPFILS